MGSRVRITLGYVIKKVTKMRFSLSPHTFWYDKDQNTKIDILCMLPNGVCIKLPQVAADLSLDDIKNVLWEKASNYLKRPRGDYVFVVVSSKGGTEELVDEKLSLFDIKPVRPYLKVIRKQGDEELKKIKSKINILIGHNLSTSKHEEVEEAQKNLTEFCSRISIQRGKSSWYRRAIYSYPPDFEEDPSVPKYLLDKYPEGLIHLSISVLKNSSNVFEVLYSIKPLELIEKALKKRAQTLKVEYTENPEDYILKIFGSESYFLGTVVIENGNECYKEIPLIQYKYIRESLLWDKRPVLMIMKREEMEICALSAANQDPPPPLLPKCRASRRNKSVSLWDLNPSTKFKVKINCALDLNTGNFWEEVRCGVFHGGNEVCEAKATSRKKGSSPVWNEFLEFDLPASDIPRMARLCFCVVGYQQQYQSKKPMGLAWVNIPIFNYRGVLRTGSFRLYCWQVAKKASNSNSGNNFFNPLGTVMNSNENGPCLVFELDKHQGSIITYAPEEFVLELAAKVIEGTAGEGEHVLLVKGGKQHKEQIEEIIKRDSLAPMFEQDKELLWKLRAECCLEYPDSLPKLLQCVKWNNKEHVSQIHFLLQSWRCETLGVDIALELLDYKFPDLKVRQRAVEVLDNISDNQLEMYLLHLVQALKYESYLDSPLARYLLRRALNNRRIGHYLFWHLKADVSNLEFSLQFGLLLELYCRGALEHIDILHKQVEAINKMKTVTEILKEIKDAPDRKKTMEHCFAGYSRSFTDIVSPLDPRRRLRKLKVDKCRIMDSKKRPLWLVFENHDDGADDIAILFKNGDDLRQDMLTLLSLRLMDNVWKSAGLDYGIIPYRCLSTGPMVGLIEVVVNAQTLGKIQAAKGSILGVWKDDNLFSWIEDMCDKNEEKLALFIQNFTRSVVGYSVAMYVLGVGDRHNDNIMMKEETGQLFHIDFGHFLGNFKTKFGFKRERVKFVLTSDIVYVINESKASTDNFNRFKALCLEAFTCLRSRGNLFITVFAMLLSTGIPELEDPTDIDYLRDSLAMLKDENDAKEHFSNTFDESYRKRGSTTANFMIHNVVHR